jgi:tetratricopeptide (TPR) repeat protein
MESGDLEGILQRLNAQQRAELLHWLTCDLCGGEAALEIAGRDGPRAFLRKRYDGGERSCANEFLERSWTDWLEDSQSDPLRPFVLALRASRELQAEKPARSGVILGDLLKEHERLLSLPGGRDVLVEAMALMINASRLAKQPEGLLHALEELDEAEILTGVGRSVEGMYRRARALTLWETGKVAQAREELALAAEAFGPGSAEEGTTLVLEGLLLVEDGQRDEAIFRLMAGLSGMARGHRPDLEIRGLLALACAVCRAGRIGEGRAYLQHVRSFYGSQASAVDHLWGQGKVLAALKETDEAVRLLTEARDRMIGDGMCGEATLATLDLSYALATAGQRPQAETEVEKLRRFDPKETWLGISGWFHTAVNETLEAWWEEKETAVWIEVRDEGPGLRPLRFV